MAMEDLALAEKAKSTKYLPRQIASQKKGLKQTITLSMLDSDGT